MCMYTRENMNENRDKVEVQIAHNAVILNELSL